MIHHAWTTPLFLKINNLVGRWSFVDGYMKFSAQYLLFLLGGILLYQWWNTDVLFSRVSLFVLLFVLSISMSYAIALVWERPRPIRQLPHIKTLIPTLGTWKSFPSDHTISATLIAYGAYLSFSGWLLLVCCSCAVSVACSRVWVGVHYPRDILGGCLLALSVIGMVHMYMS